MEIRQLQSLIKLIDCNFSVTQAADEMFIVQSAVSQHLKRLEDELEADLFIRKGKRPGAFCHDCYGELFHNRIPPLRPSRSSGMSAKARLRYRQDMA